MPERVKPRSGVREQRAARRTRRMRSALASTLAVAAVAATVITTQDLRSPFSGGRSEVLTVQDESAAMAPYSEEERRRRPPAPVTVPEPSASPSAAAKATAKAKAKTSATTANATQSTVRARLALNSETYGGFYFGASGIGVPNGEFQDWLGQPVTMASTWADTSDEVQRQPLALTAEYKD